MSGQSAAYIIREGLLGGLVGVQNSLAFSAGFFSPLFHHGLANLGQVSLQLGRALLYAHAALLQGRDGFGIDFLRSLPAALFSRCRSLQYRILRSLV